MPPTVKKLRSGFSRWLMLQATDPGPVGDLARDVAQDESWPDVDVLLDLRVYLLHHRGDGIAERAVETLEQAWTEFQRWQLG